MDAAGSVRVCVRASECARVYLRKQNNTKYPQPSLRHAADVNVGIEGLLFSRAEGVLTRVGDGTN